MNYDWLETLINESCNALKEYDISVFFNPLFNDHKFESFDIEKRDNFIILKNGISQKEVVTYKKNSSPYNISTAIVGSSAINGNINVYNKNPFYVDLPDYHSIEYVNYTYSFVFRQDGFIGFDVKRKNETLLNIIVGNSDILIYNENGYNWYNKETFEEFSFQNSLIEPRKNFDLFYINSVLKNFKLV